MALTINIPGGKVQLSGNRVQAEVETGTITGEMYNLLLKTTSLDESFPEGIDATEPDSDKKAVFDIRNRVTLPIVYSFTWPLTGAVAIEQPQMAKKVALDIGEKYVEVVSGENKDKVNWSELTGADYQVLILKGGVSKHQQAKYNEGSTTFYQEWIAGGKFLTMLPDNMRIAPGQPVKLWFITKEATAQALTMVVDYKTTEGVNDYEEIPVTINPDKLFELCVNPGDLGLVASEITSYSVKLEKSGVTIGEIRNFQVDHEYYENNTYVLFANRVGGIDCLWFTGRVKRMFPTESERSQRDARIDDTQQRPTLEVDWKAGRRKWVVNTGYKEPDEMEALAGLYESRNVWLLNGNDIIPVMVEDGDNEYLDTMKDVHDVDIVFTEAH
jgi:hypothetical protein